MLEFVSSKLYEYDPATPLDIKEAGIYFRDAIAVHDISYASPRGGRVTAYLVVPPGTALFSSVLFLHPRRGNRSTFLEDAMRLANHNILSLLIDAPFARPKNRRLRGKSPEVQSERRIQAIIDLRRALDLLISRSDVDPERIGYVGHSYGASMGGVLTGIEKRVKAYVLMAGGPSFSDFVQSSDYHTAVKLRTSFTKEDLETYLKLIAPLDAVHYISYASPSALFFQFGLFDKIISKENAMRFQQAASEPKLVKWYNSGHKLNEKARLDRERWLCTQFGLLS